MIDHKTESVVPLEASSALFPTKPSRCTLYRWSLKGIRGVRLETLACGGKRYTSHEAIDRFIAAQNSDDPTTPAIMPAQRRRQSEAAQIELQRMGVAR